MAREADLFLRHRQGQGRHVTLGPRHVTHRARSRHGRVHRLPADFLRVAGRAIRVDGKNARVLNAPCRHRRQQQQKKGSDPRARDGSHRRRVILVSRHRPIITKNQLAPRKSTPRAISGREARCLSRLDRRRSSGRVISITHACDRTHNAAVAMKFLDRGAPPLASSAREPALSEVERVGNLILPFRKSQASSPFRAQPLPTAPVPV